VAEEHSHPGPGTVTVTVVVARLKVDIIVAVAHEVTVDAGQRDSVADTVSGALVDSLDRPDVGDSEVENVEESELPDDVGALVAVVDAPKGTPHSSKLCPCEVISGGSPVLESLSIHSRSTTPFRQMFAMRSNTHCRKHLSRWSQSTADSPPARSSTSTYVPIRSRNMSGSSRPGCSRRARGLSTPGRTSSSVRRHLRRFFRCRRNRTRGGNRAAATDGGRHCRPPGWLLGHST
jgi:hypothetical protein